MAPAILFDLVDAVIRGDAAFSYLIFFCPGGWAFWRPYSYGNLAVTEEEEEEEQRCVTLFQCC